MSNLVDDIKSFTLEVLLPVLFFGGGAILFCAAGFVAVSMIREATIGRSACSNFATFSKIETNWTLTAGCLVRAPNGEVMSLSTYQSRNVQNRHQVEIK